MHMVFITILSHFLFLYRALTAKNLCFGREAAEMFLFENVPRYVRGERLLNPVDVKAGY